MDGLSREKFPRSFLKGREVGHRFHLNGSRQIAAIDQEILQAAVIKFEKVFQNQTGKELPLGKFFGTVLMRIFGENLCADAPSLK